MQNRKPQLPIIDYNDTEFTTHSFNALHKYGAFILKNVPKIATDASLLLKEFNKLTAQPEDNIKPFLAGSDVLDIAGYHPQEQHWAGRRFSPCYGLVSDSEGKISQPFATHDFRQATIGFMETARHLSEKVLNAIGTELNMQKELSGYLQGYSVLGVVDSYVPPTQEKIAALDNKLIMGTDNYLEVFEPHRDATPLAISTYDNNDCNGLEMQLPDESGNLAYVPITLPKAEANQVSLLILAGEPLEALTDGQLRAPKHRVVLEPMKSGEKFNRRLVSAFTMFGPNNKFSSNEYFNDKYKNMKQDSEEKSQAISAELLEQFPTEADIEVQVSSKGPIYTRR
jgi:hypothetical protein